MVIAPPTSYSCKYHKPYFLELAPSDFVANSRLLCIDHRCRWFKTPGWGEVAVTRGVST